MEIFLLIIAAFIVLSSSCKKEYVRDKWGQKVCRK
jgi:hypothetical protein